MAEYKSSSRMERRSSSYLALAGDGRLEERAKTAMGLLKSCTLCANACRCDRTGGERGRCGAGIRPVVGSSLPHFGEEPPFNGHAGAGAIFFAHCGLRCRFCQNHEISQEGKGREVSREELVRIMLGLQERGCHNIDLVSPTHYVPAILDALTAAAAMGLRIPLVYNTNGTDSLETLRLLDGIVDLYLPDMKYSSDVTAARLSDAVDYRETNRKAVKEMYRQVGPLQCDGAGVATRGMIVRHLVLPGGLAGSYSTLRFVATEISTDLTMSLMSQYTPLYHAASDAGLNRKITDAEYARVISAAGQLGFQDCFIQDPGSAGFGVPDFGEPVPFHW